MHTHMHTRRHSTTQACHEITAAYARDDQWHYTYDQYMELAAVRAQVELGNYDASKHTRGTCG